MPANKYVILQSQLVDKEINIPIQMDWGLYGQDMALNQYESYVIEALSYELRLSENKLLGSSAIQLWRNGDCLFIYRANKTTAGLDLPEGQLERVASFSEWPM